VRNSKKDEYSDNKTIYKYLRINQLYSLYNQHIYYLYYMHIKDHLTRLENKSKRKTDAEPITNTKNTQNRLETKYHKRLKKQSIIKD
jgi:hypothetical protein